MKQIISSKGNNFGIRQSLLFRQNLWIPPKSLSTGLSQDALVGNDITIILGCKSKYVLVCLLL